MSEVVTLQNRCTDAVLISLSLKKPPWLYKKGESNPKSAQLSSSQTAHHLYLTFIDHIYISVAVCFQFPPLFPPSLPLCLVFTSLFFSFHSSSSSSYFWTSFPCSSFISPPPLSLFPSAVQLSWTKLLMLSVCLLFLRDPRVLPPSVYFDRIHNVARLAPTSCSLDQKISIQ